MPRTPAQQDDRMLQAADTATPASLDISRFLARRAWKNAEALAALATCSSPLEALDVWREAALNAIDDYTEEAGRILEPQPA